MMLLCGWIDKGMIRKMERSVTHLGFSGSDRKEGRRKRGTLFRKVYAHLIDDDDDKEKYDK